MGIEGLAGRLEAQRLENTPSTDLSEAPKAEEAQDDEVIKCLKNVLEGSERLALNCQGTHVRSIEAGHFAAVILRDIPVSAQHEIHSLFGPHLANIRGVVHELGDNWYVFFNSN